MGTGRTIRLEESRLPTPEVFEVWSVDGEKVFVIPLLSVLEPTDAMRQSHERWSELLDDPGAIKYSAVVVKDPIVDHTWRNLLEAWSKSFDDRTDRVVVSPDRPLTSFENVIFDRYSSIVEGVSVEDLPDIRSFDRGFVTPVVHRELENAEEEWVFDSSRLTFDDDRYQVHASKLRSIDDALEPLVSWYDESLTRLDDEVLRLGVEYLSSLDNDDETEREEWSNPTVESLRTKVSQLFDKIELLDEVKVDILATVVDEAEARGDIDMLNRVRGVRVCAAEISKNVLDARIDSILAHRTKDSFGKVATHV